MRQGRWHFSVLLTTLCLSVLICSCAAKRSIVVLEDGWWDVAPADTAAPPDTETALADTELLWFDDDESVQETALSAGNDVVPPVNDTAVPVVNDTAVPPVSDTAVPVVNDAAVPVVRDTVAPAKDVAAPSAKAPAAPSVKTPAAAPVKDTVIPPVRDPAAQITPVRWTPPVISDSAAAAFTEKFVRASRDSLLAIIRSDYAICVGDPANVSNDRLLNWKAHVDSLVMDSGYPERFRAYVAATGIKAHDVRPCEPIVFAERRERERRAVDSASAAQRVVREKARNDSAALAAELSALKSHPADVLGIPAGISKASLQMMLARNNIETKTVQGRLQASGVKFKNLTVTVAFYFGDDDKYIGYEAETEALMADRLDGTVREWAARLASAYEETLGPPDAVTRVSFQDIRQGRMSITANWKKGPARPRVLVGLATHNHLYYAKVMVSY
jgi:hypothetical protein